MSQSDWPELRAELVARLDRLIALENAAYEVLESLDGYPQPLGLSDLEAKLAALRAVLEGD